MKGSRKVNWRDSIKKHMANFREQPHGWSHDSAKHLKLCEKHGGMHETPWGGARCTNKKDWIKRRNFSSQVDHECKSSSSTEYAHVQLSLRIKKLEKSQQKIMQQIKKWSCHYTNENEDSSTSCCEHPNTTPEYSRKSKKACRHQISLDTSSQLRKGITGELK